MRKLKLEVERLEVESFEVRGEMEGEGTVHGLALSTALTCSYSVGLKCFAPQETITMDPNDGACNTQYCSDGGVSDLGCDTGAACV